MFLDGWKVSQILHNQVQRTEFTQPRVLLNVANVMDAGIAAIPCELWAERRDGQSQQMAQTCVSESTPEFVIDMIHG